MILVTGGAGYIGSHTVHLLRAYKMPVIVLDNLSTGFKWAVPEDVQLIVGDVGDVALVKDLLTAHKVDSVIHFAGSLSVEESTKIPDKYYFNNYINSFHLIKTCEQAGVKNFVFSSTSAVYGTPQNRQVREADPVDPVSPYGRSKLMIEWALEDLSKVSSMKHVILRYFNVAGAKVTGGLGQATQGATQLVKVATEVVLGLRPQLNLFGADYPTEDGTCVRDYIHVDDLAEAHIAALKYLNKNRNNQVLNCGYGKGYSVREVIASMKKVTGVDFKVVETDRRAGDAVALYANVEKIKNTLAWTPKYDDLELICKTSVEWEKELSQRGK